MRIHISADDPEATLPEWNDSGKEIARMAENSKKMDVESMVAMMEVREWRRIWMWVVDFETKKKKLNFSRGLQGRVLLHSLTSSHSFYILPEAPRRTLRSALSERFQSRSYRTHL